MREFISETDTTPKLRAWIIPEDPNDNIQDPHVPRADGWRVVIEQLEPTGERELIRSTWEESLTKALQHVEIRWPRRPVWRDSRTNEIVNLAATHKSG